MKYLTKELWSALQEPSDVGQAAAQQWDETLATYLAELESLGGRLAPDVFAFFRDADVHDVHDGSLVHLQIRDFDPLVPRPVDSTDDDDPDGTDLGRRCSTVPATASMTGATTSSVTRAKAFCGTRSCSRREPSSSSNSATYQSSASIVRSSRLSSSPTDGAPAQVGSWLFQVPWDLGVGRWECFGDWSLEVGS